MSPTVEDILKILERRSKRAQGHLNLCRSERSKMKARVRLSEASEALGEVRAYVKHPERI